MIEDPPVIKELYEMISQASKGEWMKATIINPSEKRIEIEWSDSENCTAIVLTEERAKGLLAILRSAMIKAGWVDKDEPVKEELPKTFTAEQVNTILEKQVETTRAAMATCDIEHGQSRIQNHEAAKFIARSVKSELR